jgi:hypothetical protein
MNKRIVLTTVLMLLMSILLSAVSMATTVDCGPGDLFFCRERDVQKPIDEIDEQLNDVGNDIDSLEQTIAEKDALWSKDEEGGSGLTIYRLGRALVGNDTFLLDFKGTFLDFLRTVFVPEHDYSNDQAHLEDRMNALAALTGISVEDWDLATAQQQAYRTDMPVEHNGYICMPREPVCRPKP